MAIEIPERHRGTVATVKRACLNIVGLLLIINGIGLLAVYTLPGGILMLAAGGFVLPKTRATIEARTQFTLTRLTAIGIFSLLYFTASAFVIISVDLSKAPDFMVPF